MHSAVDSLRYETRVVLSKTLNVSEEELPAPVSRENFPTWSSLYHMVLILALEERFGISLTTDEVVEMNAEDAILAVLSKRSVMA